MNISGPAAVAKPEMLFYAPGDLTVTCRYLGGCIFVIKHHLEVSQIRPMQKTMMQQKESTAQ